MNQEALSNRRVLPHSASGQKLVNTIPNDFGYKHCKFTADKFEGDRNTGGVTDNDENEHSK